MFGIIYFLTLYLQNVRGYSALESGVRTLPMTLMVMLIAPIAGKLSTRIGPRPLMVGGMLIMSLGLASLTRLSLDSSYWTVIFPSFICVGAGVVDDDADDARASRWARSTRRARASPPASSTRRGRSAARSVSRCSARSPRRVASAHWADNAPAALQGTADALDPLVVGGQVEHDRQRRRPRGRRWPRSQAFVDGVTTAMTVGSLLALAGAVIAFFGLRGFRARGGAAAQEDRGRRRRASPSRSDHARRPRHLTVGTRRADARPPRPLGCRGGRVRTPARTCSGTSRSAPGSRRPSRRPSPGATRSS